MKNSNFFWGLGLVAVAILLVANGMGILPDVPWLQAIISLLFAVYALRQIWKRRFFGSMLALGCIAWIWEGYLGIEAITPFPLLFAAGLLGIGLNLMFGKRHRIVTFTKDGHTVQVDSDGIENWQDGRHVTLENVFNSTNKYVNSDAFSSAEFSNVFGSANVYFNNAVIAGGVADVKVENVFGKMNLYFPGTWRLQVDKEAVFGAVHVYGHPSTIAESPLIRLDADSVFGEVNIYFE